MNHTQQHHSGRTFTCTQCPKIFATRSNLKRHMENPNIHNIPYVRSRDQKRWKGHAKKVVSKEETTERMRKWRAENREKNRQNDLRCRVYRLARQRFGDVDTPEKQKFVRDEITRRLGRHMIMEQKENHHQQQRQHQQHQHQYHHQHHCHPYQHDVFPLPTHNGVSSKEASFLDLPFYNAKHKIELPCIIKGSTTFPTSPTSSPPTLAHMSPTWRAERRTSSSTIGSSYSDSSPATSTSNLLDTIKPQSPMSTDEEDPDFTGLRPTYPSHYPSEIKYVEQTRILDEFVGVVLNYASHHS